MKSENSTRRLDGVDTLSTNNHIRVVVLGFCWMVDTCSNVANGFRYWMIAVRVSWLVVVVSREFWVFSSEWGWDNHFCMDCKQIGKVIEGPTNQNAP